MVLYLRKPDALSVLSISGATAAPIGWKESYTDLSALLRNSQSKNRVPGGSGGGGHHPLTVRAGCQGCAIKITVRCCLSSTRRQILRVSGSSAAKLSSKISTSACCR